MTIDRIEVQRTIPASPSAIFRILSDPHGHVTIDSSGMLMSAEGERVTGVGDTFVVHMDREALNDYPLGLYDVPSHDHDVLPGPRDRLDRGRVSFARRSDTSTGTASKRSTTPRW